MYKITQVANNLNKQHNITVTYNDIAIIEFTTLYGADNAIVKHIAENEQVDDNTSIDTLFGMMTLREYFEMSEVRVIA